MKQSPLGTVKVKFDSGSLKHLTSNPPKLVLDLRLITQSEYAKLAALLDGEDEDYDFDIEDTKAWVITATYPGGYEHVLFIPPWWDHENYFVRIQELLFLVGETKYARNVTLSSAMLLFDRLWPSLRSRDYVFQRRLKDGLFTATHYREVEKKKRERRMLGYREIVIDEENAEIPHTAPMKVFNALKAKSRKPGKRRSKYTEMLELIAAIRESRK